MITGNWSAEMKNGHSFFQFSDVTTLLHIIIVVTFHKSILVNKKLSMPL